MQRFIPVTFILMATSWCWAQQGRVVPREILDRIVDDDPNPLPRYMTPAERLLPLPAPSLRDMLRASAPTGAVDTPAEYERNEYLVVANKLSKNAIILGDNSDITDELLDFSLGTGRHFVFFSEKSKGHWFAGGGIGISFVGGATEG